MNKKLLPIINIMFIFYLLVSFIVWDLHPSHWNISVRFAYAFFCPILSIITYFILSDNKN